ncbi:MAG: SOS response-associated peptidase [Bacteroidota bacterium]|nr:SOS response-associated peptidase [Bacteroidota bacterium]
MCYHYGFGKEKVALEKRFSAEIRTDDFRPMYHVSAYGPESAHLPVILNEDPARFRFIKWGLVPFWSKERNLPYSTHNARVEDISKKPAFREPIRKRRCLIPADGFYEWRHEGKNKIPHWIQIKDNSLFAFAGIWDEWTDSETGEILPSFSILTTEANPMMAEIHNSKKRMPVILTREKEQDWLSDISLEQVLEIPKPFDENRMEAWPIERSILKVPGWEDHRAPLNTLF